MASSGSYIRLLDAENATIVLDPSVELSYVSHRWLLSQNPDNAATVVTVV